jgi:hypothetical protein
MNLSPHIWFGLFFLLALIYQRFTGLNQKAGVRLHFRIGYAVLVSTGFIVLFLGTDELRPTDRVATSVATIVFSIPFVLYSVAHLRNHIQGAMIVYRRHFRWYYIFIPGVLLVMLRFITDPLQLFIRYNWVLVGFLLACWSASICQLVYVLRLESRLKEPIIEQRQN